MVGLNYPHQRQHLVRQKIHSFSNNVTAAMCFGTITECKFVCLTHSEANQTQALEFGADKGLLQSQARRMGGSCSKKNPKALVVLGGKIWSEGCRACNFFSHFLSQDVEVPRPGVKPAPQQWQHWILSHKATRELLHVTFF